MKMKEEDQISYFNPLLVKSGVAHIAPSGGIMEESETWMFTHMEKPVRLCVTSAALGPPTAIAPSQSGINSPLIDPTMRLLTGWLTRRNVRPAASRSY